LLEPAVILLQNKKTSRSMGREVFSRDSTQFQPTGIADGPHSADNGATRSAILGQLIQPIEPMYIGFIRLIG
jgi:hypothetical protein